MQGSTYIAVVSAVIVFSGASHSQCPTQVNIDGFGSAANAETSLSASDFGGDLFVGTFNGITGCEVWRYDGVTWTSVATGGFDDAANWGVAYLTEFNGCLHATTINAVTGGEVWRYCGASWEQVNADGFSNPLITGAYFMAVYNGDLYVGTENRMTGSEVWRTGGIGGPPYTDWTPVNSPGFGDPVNVETFQMAVFNGSLFAGTHVSGGTGCRVYMYTGGTSWVQVNTNGFGDTNNEETVGMVVLGNYLYVGTTNETTGAEVWRTAGQGGPPYTWKQVNEDGWGNPANDGGPGLLVLGGRLYAGVWPAFGGGRALGTSAAGDPPFDDWLQIGTDGFGDANNYAIWPVGVYGGRIYWTTSNDDTGCEVWEVSPGASTFRNAALNPASYTASAAVLGGTLTGTVDNNLAGQTTSALFAFDTSVSVVLAGGQTLLCLDTGGNGELFTGGGLTPSGAGGGIDTFSLAIPNNFSLCGLTASSQAIQFGVPPFVLSNAQDLTVGI